MLQFDGKKTAQLISRKKVLIDKLLFTLKSLKNSRIIIENENGTKSPKSRSYNLILLLIPTQNSSVTMKVKLLVHFNSFSINEFFHRRELESKE